MGDVILSMDYLEEENEALGVAFCRICHEEEFESFKTLEAPCSCCGTAKYAHRDCIQKWCNEKGNTSCEICLQTFEPGFTSVHNNTTGVTIRRSLEEVSTTRSPRLTRSYSTIVMVTDHESLLLINNQEQCSSSSAHKTAVFCRSLAIALTVVLLMKHLIDICSSGIAAEYPFSLATVKFSFIHYPFPLLVF
ncbi:uncharacterized protein LOC124937396 [Impatiens glandulifera]|uniref:uncharacterized protein LOC124937396 n=1 Tax=Impatiens glandulifera TaxID=253017 RepID=UPI001FB078F3|nr:uncharacterized protein LOC124937396 [Impatiens glandulifera]